METMCFTNTDDDFDADRPFRQIGEVLAQIVGAILATGGSEAVGAASLDDE